MSKSVKAPPEAAADVMGDALLTAAEICKFYEMGSTQLRVLEDCNLRVSAGEFVAIMGKSGSGKSTLLHVLGALVVPQRGQVLFDGQPVFAPPNARRLTSGMTDVFSGAERRRIELRRRAFGFVFQFYYLLPELNVLENVLITRMVGTKTLGWWRAVQPPHGRTH